MNEGRDAPRDDQRDDSLGVRAADQRLVERIRGGAPAAVHEFVGEYHHDVYAYLLALTGRRETAEDLTQDTFLRAWRSIHQFDSRRASLRTWLHAIARRQFSDWRQKERVEAPLEAALGVADSRAAALLEAVETRDAVRNLPAELSEVVVLHYLEGQSCREIAALIGRPEGTVKWWLSEARALLRRDWAAGGRSRAGEPHPKNG